MPETEDGSSALVGNLLCAVPQLSDPNFRRSVVLMLDHSETGALGLVLNQPVPHAMTDVAESLGVRWAGPCRATARQGGPVEPMRGWVLHDNPAFDPGARAILPGVLLTTSLQPIQSCPGGRLGEGMRMLFLLGYAGWGPGQLEGEMALGSWVTVPLKDATAGGLPPDWVFEADPGDMWDGALASIGVDPARLVGLSGLRGRAVSGPELLLH